MFRTESETRLTGMSPKEMIEYLRLNYPDQLDDPAAVSLLMRVLGKSTKDWNSPSDCLGKPGE